MKVIKSLALAIVASAPVLSMAAPIDFTPLTSGLDFTSISTAILAVGVSIGGVYVAIRGAKTVLSMIRG